MKLYLNEYDREARTVRYATPETPEPSPRAVNRYSDSRYLLALQGAAGNAAVSAALQRRAESALKGDLGGQVATGRGPMSRTGLEPSCPSPMSSVVVQRKPTTTQAGTVLQFMVVFDATPSGMSQTTGQDAHNAMLRLGETELSWSGPLPTTTPYFNQRPARYIYTTQGGWIDMVHFLFHAGRAYKYLVDQRDAAKSLREIESLPWYQRMWLPAEYLQELRRRSGQSPVGESVQEGFQTERMQQVFTPRSAFSYEDLPSDTFGAQFAVQHFNPNARLTLGEQLAAYLTNVLGATTPTVAPNYSTLPANDDGNVDRQNYTTAPTYTAANP